MTNPKTVLVTGGTGKTGRRIAQQLATGGHTVRIGSRSADQPFDWNDPVTWKTALDGVAAAYVAFYPDLAFPGAAETVGTFVEKGKELGVERFVLLSGRGEEGAERSEALFSAADPQGTILRSSFFNQNFSEHFLLGPVLEGVIAFPAADMVEPFVDADDIAEIAVAALTEPGHEGQLYELTGPRLLSFHDVAADLSESIGRTITYQPVTPDEYVEMAVAHGLPIEEAAPLAELFAEVLDGRNAHTTDTIAQVLGRPAKDFRYYATKTARTGVWNIEGGQR
jgi:uncharacterized protein YbjT (DUF2867 family)